MFCPGGISEVAAERVGAARGLAQGSGRDLDPVTLEKWIRKGGLARRACRPEVGLSILRRARFSQVASQRSAMSVLVPREDLLKEAGENRDLRHDALALEQVSPSIQTI